MDNIKLKKAYLIAAKLVSKFGDAHLPVFERLHGEIISLNKNEDLKRLAFQLEVTN